MILQRRRLERSHPRLLTTFRLVREWSVREWGGICEGSKGEEKWKRARPAGRGPGRNREEAGQSETG